MASPYLLLQFYFLVFKLAKGHKFIVELRIKGTFDQLGQELVGEMNIIIAKLQGKSGKKLSVALQLERLDQDGIWTDRVIL